MSTTSGTESPNPTARRRWPRRVGVSLLLAVALPLAGFAVWLGLGDAADPEDLAAAVAAHDIAVVDDGQVLTITPRSQMAGATPLGIAFLPGTRVQRDAYVATWAPIVEATGVPVHISAVPLNLPALGDGAIGEIIDANPDTTKWIVGGHSMGGLAAAAYVAAQPEPPAGLLLWAAGPGRTDLSAVEITTLIVAGGSDTVLPPDRIINESQTPPMTTVEVIAGMVHGQFGRYSDTEGGTEGADGPERRSDAETLADLTSVTEAFIAQVADEAG